MSSDAATVSGKTCSRCRNHGMRVVLKGHKRQCPHRYCTCDRCDLVTMRRQILAEEASIQKKQEAESSLLAAGRLCGQDNLDSRKLSDLLKQHKSAVKKYQKYILLRPNTFGDDHPKPKIPKCKITATPMPLVLLLCNFVSRLSRKLYSINC
ncbi:doublesex- and mab-3-related transcription factor C2-like [Dermacentor silvarum]|uniref:doublesex- and mab-3-related transcription factor C2-like n=1 Tax=Dermacentor silvarum TaxID=543639 RepID=UPI002101B86C|nr:doublesex- and mab-3-related transcription factor C2-like [Dermacentor silvarum]